MTQASAGWYPDPSGNTSKLRFWDGNQWTDQYGDVTNTVEPSTSKDKTLYLVAFIFSLLSTIGMCWLIIPLAWTIPMTVHCWGIYKGTNNNTVAFGVCTLIFVNLVAGICLLVGRKEQ